MSFLEWGGVLPLGRALVFLSSTGVRAERLMPKIFPSGESSDIASTDDVILWASLPLLLPGELGGVLNAAIRFFLGC